MHSSLQFFLKGSQLSSHPISARLPLELEDALSGPATDVSKTKEPGSNSPAGCGSNSDYTVTWSVIRERVSGRAPYSLRQFLQAQQLKLNPGLRSLDPTSKSISVRDFLGLS
jgi:hypothetical protein